MKPSILTCTKVILSDEERRLRRREYHRTWYEANADKQREARRVWSSDNAERKRETDKLWKANNADRVRASQKRWRDTHPDRHIKVKFGLTTDQYESVLVKQGGLCAICQKPEKIIDPRTGSLRRLAVDHCHKTGTLRGLLCTSCNHGIGKLCDDSTIIRRAADYIDRYAAAPETELEN